MLCEIWLSRSALDAILSVQDHARPTVGIEHGRRGRQLLEPMSGLLAARAIARGGQDRRAGRLEFHLAALARRDEVCWPCLAHCAFPIFGSARVSYGLQIPYFYKASN